MNNSSLKILHICASDLIGGACRAAFRLHKSLLENGNESLFIVNRKISDSPEVFCPNNTFKKVMGLSRSLIDKFPLQLYNNKKPGLFSNNFIYGMSIPKEKIEWCDVIHLHWIGSGSLLIERVAKFNKPIVWRLPDMFAFTGGCHYSQGCDKFKNHCQKCHVLGSNHKHDLAWLNWSRKKRTYDQISNLTIATPSKWMYDCAKQASVLKNASVVYISTGTNINIYKPIGKNLSLDLMGLPSLKYKKNILFGAMNATLDPRKGYKQLIDAIGFFKKNVRNIDAYSFLVFGSSNPNGLNVGGIDIHFLGGFNDEIALNLVYNSADVFVSPSLEDNLPNTALEAMACGVPVVSFNVGGMPDLIDHESNGYLAKPIEPEDLAQGIAWVLEDDSRHKTLCDNARDKILNNFSLEKVTKQYEKLYDKIINHDGQ